MECGRAGTDRESVWGVDEPCEILLETFHLGSGGDPVRAQSVDYIVNLFISDQRRREGEECVSHLL
jgi:hypothetical protein